MGHFLTPFLDTLKKGPKTLFFGVLKWPKTMGILCDLAQKRVKNGSKRVKKGVF